MPEEWKNERPAWCTHKDCRYCLRAQDALCVGHLPEPVAHGPDTNIYRLCIQAGEVFDLQLNDSDIYHFQRLFETLQEGPSNLVDMIDDQPITKMPTHCYASSVVDATRRLETCGGKVASNGKFMVCEKCGVSYGRAGKGKG